MKLTGSLKQLKSQELSNLKRGKNELYFPENFINWSWFNDENTSAIIGGLSQARTDCVNVYEVMQLDIQQDFMQSSMNETHAARKL